LRVWELESRRELRSIETGHSSYVLDTAMSWDGRIAVSASADNTVKVWELESPTSSTIPAKSLPWPEGNVAGQRLANNPFRIEDSPGLMPAAFTRTKTFPGPGFGRSTSTTCRTSSPP